MAYKYFTEKLLSSDLNLADVFPIQQDDARNQVNASYNLFEIAQFIQDRTDNFKNTEQQYIDLDSAISEIINKWYKSQGKPNPFVQVSVDEEFDSTNPRESAIVDSGKIKSKGTPASAPRKTKEPEKVVKEVKVVEVTEPELSDSEKIEKLKVDLERARQIYYDVLDEEEQATYLSNLEKRLVGAEMMAEDGDEYLVQRYNILKDFANSYK
jgi:valyl-tRNA synthetase